MNKYIIVYLKVILQKSKIYNFKHKNITLFQNFYNEIKSTEYLLDIETILLHSFSWKMS